MPIIAACMYPSFTLFRGLGDSDNHYPFVDRNNKASDIAPMVWKTLP